MTKVPEVKPVTRYVWEYGNFLSYVKAHKVSRAVIYAQTLGIDRRTLVHWMSQPELRDAMTEALDDLVDGMQRAGKNDWRMYRELMKIMGVQDMQSIDLSSSDGTMTPRVIIESTYGTKPKFRTDNSDAKANELAENSSPESS